MTNISTPTNPPSIQNIVIEVYGPTVMPEDEQQAYELIDKICEVLHLNVVRRVFNQFVPIGITAVAVLTESHLALHTWPENNYLRVDIVTCPKKEMGDIEKKIASVQTAEKIVVKEYDNK